MSGGPTQTLQAPGSRGRPDDEVLAVQVAVRTVRRRLEDVWSMLRTACDGQADPECVHRLRVATRRAFAALDAFDEFVPEGASRWFRRSLRRVRRAAGEARDLDVLAGRIERDDRGHTAASTARRRLVAMLARQRPAARRPVVRVRERLLHAGWTARVERLIDRLARRHDRTPFATYGRRRLKRLVRRFFEHARPRIRDPEEIHRLRIEGKRLRYTLEIFAPVLPRRGRMKCQRAMERLQDHLGLFTDHATVADRLRRWSGSHATEAYRTVLTTIRKTESGAAERARKAFLRWWSESRRRELQRRFRQTLREGSA